MCLQTRPSSAKKYQLTRKKQVSIQTEAVIILQQSPSHCEDFQVAFKGYSNLRHALREIDLDDFITRTEAKEFCLHCPSISFVGPKICSSSNLCSWCLDFSIFQIHVVMKKL